MKITRLGALAFRQPVELEVWSDAEGEYVALIQEIESLAKGRTREEAERLLCENIQTERGMYRDGYNLDAVARRRKELLSTYLGSDRVNWAVLDEFVELHARKPTPSPAITVQASDIEATKAFYEAQLGVSFKSEQHGSGPVHYAVDLGGCVFEIYPADAMVRSVVWVTPTVSERTVVSDPDGNEVFLLPSEGAEE
jgi:hypothetical protein